MRRMRRWQTGAWAAAAGALVALLASAGPALAARVASVSPTGEVATVRQVVVRFDEAVVPAGDPRLPAPFTLRCNGATAPGEGPWTSDPASCTAATTTGCAWPRISGPQDPT